MALGLLGGLAIGGLVGGTLMSAWSKYQEGKMAEQLYKYNRAISLRYAKAVAEARAYEKTRYLRAGKKLISAIRPTVAKAGLEMRGTPLKVSKEAMMRLKEEGDIMDYETAMEQWRIKAGADITAYQGKMAAYAGRMGAFSTLLTGAGQLGMVGYQMGWGRPKSTLGETI